MQKFRKFNQTVLALILAIGFLLSPLQTPGVVFSARSADDLPPPAEPVAEPQIEPLAEEQPITGVVELSPEAPVEGEISSPEPGSPPDVESTLPADEVDSPVEPQTTPQVDEPTAATEPDATAEPPAFEVTTAVEPVESIPANEGEQTDAPEGSAPQAQDWVSGQAILRFDPSIPTDEQIARLSALGLEVTSSIPALGVLIVGIPAGLEQESASMLAEMDGVLYAEPVYLASALDTTPNDPAFASQGDMVAINAPGGWDFFTGSSSITIAIIDSGVDLTHPEFAGKLLPGYDYVNNDADPQDDYGHGTHVAGIAAATGNNSTGIAGLDWSAMILPVKVLDNSGFGSAENVANGIVFAVDNGAKIINLSLGFASNSVLVQNAVNYAYLHGVTVVASTGNSNGVITYPAALPHVIAVGAVDNTGSRWASSNYGSEIDVVAPGVNIYSTNPAGYGTRTGTSMAAPHVAGLAALLSGMYPLSPDQVESTIVSTSRDLGTAGWDAYFGNGLIQVREALFRLWNALLPRSEENTEEDLPTAEPYPTFTPTPTITPTPTFTLTPVQ